MATATAKVTGTAKAMVAALAATTITTTTTYNNQLNVGPPLVDCDDDDNDDNAGDSNGNGNGKGDLPYNKIKLAVAGTGPDLRSGPVWSMPPNIIYNTIFTCCREEGKRTEGRCQDKRTRNRRGVSSSLCKNSSCVVITSMSLHIRSSASSTWNRMTIRRTTNWLEEELLYRGIYRTSAQTDRRTDRRTDGRTIVILYYNRDKLKGFAMYICWGHFG
jgi:hypothetical protein